MILTMKIKLNNGKSFQNDSSLIFIFLENIHPFFQNTNKDIAIIDIIAIIKK